MIYTLEFKVISSCIKCYSVFCSKVPLFTFFNWFSEKQKAEFRSSPVEVFLGKVVLKKFSNFTGQHQYWSALRHGCSPVNLLYIFRTPQESCFWRLVFHCTFFLTASYVQPSLKWLLLFSYIKGQNTAWKVSVFGVFQVRFFSTFGLNTGRYLGSLCIQSECGKIRTRKSSNTDTFHAVKDTVIF